MRLVCDAQSDHLCWTTRRACRNNNAAPTQIPTNPPFNTSVTLGVATKAVSAISIITALRTGIDAQDVFQADRMQADQHDAGGTHKQYAHVHQVGRVTLMTNDSNRKIHPDQ